MTTPAPIERGTALLSSTGAASHHQTADGLRSDRIADVSAELERQRARSRILERQLVSLFQRRENIQQEVRRCIARDVHDHLGQQMTALRMQLELLQTQCGSHQAVLDQIAKAQRLAETLDRGLDNLVAQLHPTALPDADFAAALSTLLAGWSARFGIATQCAIASEGTGPLPENTAANLLAITEEALHNVAKHARATSVNLSLNREGDVLVLLIEDDGRGFSPSHDGRRGRGFGLVSMRERAELAGGEFAIQSSPNGGVTICVRLPLAANSEPDRQEPA